MHTKRQKIAYLKHVKKIPITFLMLKPHPTLKFNIQKINKNLPLKLTTCPTPIEKH
jgi:hypothetical protein